MSTLSNNTSNDKSMNGLVTIEANSISTDELDVDTLVVNLEATVPTVSALFNDTHAASTAWVTSHVSGAYVTIGTTQTISGQKIFSNANTFISGILTAGSATITGALSAASAGITGLITAGSATISGALSAASAGISGLLTAGSATVTGALSAGSAGISGLLTAGSATIPSIATNTITSAGTLQLNSVALDMNATGDITIDTSADYLTFTKTGGTGGISFNSANFVSMSALGACSLSGAGFTELVSTSANVILQSYTTTKVESITSSIELKSPTSITLTAPATTITGALTAGSFSIAAFTTNTISGTTVGSTISLYNENSRTGDINFGNGLGRTGIINIGSGLGGTSGGINIGVNGGGVIMGASSAANTINGTTTLLGTTTINGTGGSTTQIGNSSASIPITNLLGTININVNPSVRSQNIGNSTGVTTIYGSTTFDGATVETNLVPPATITMKVTSSVSQGWLYCDGTSYSTTTYARLYAAIGYTFGGAGASFNVPNFKGAFLRGASTQTVGGVAYTADAVGTAQQDQVLTAIYGKQQGYFNLAGGSGRQCVSRAVQSGDPYEDSNNIAQFSRQGTENRPFNHAVYYYIKY